MVNAVDGLPDMEIGKCDLENPAGNHVILETAGGVRLLLCKPLSGFTRRQIEAGITGSVAPHPFWPQMPPIA